MKKRSLQPVIRRIPLSRIGSSASRGVQEQHVRHYDNGRAVMVNRGINHKVVGPVVRRPFVPVIRDRKSVPVISLRPRKSNIFVPANMSRREFLDKVRQSEVGADLLSFINLHADEFWEQAFDEYNSLPVEPRSLEDFEEAILSIKEDVEMGWGGKDMVSVNPVNFVDGPLAGATTITGEEPLEFTYYHEDLEGIIGRDSSGSWLAKDFVSLDSVSGIDELDAILHDDLHTGFDANENRMIDNIRALYKADIPFLIINSTYAADLAVKNDDLKKAKDAISKFKGSSWHSMPGR